MRRRPTAGSPIGSRRAGACRALHDLGNNPLPGHLAVSGSHDGAAGSLGLVDAPADGCHSGPAATNGGGRVTTHPHPTRGASTAAPSTRAAGAPISSRGPADLSWVPRRYGQWAAAVLFVLVMALAAGWLWNQKNDRREVLAVAGSVPAGTVIDRGDLRVEKVAGVDHTIGVGGVDDVVGSTAVVGLVPGQVLSRDMLTTEPVPGPGERVVGSSSISSGHPTVWLRRSWLCWRCRLRVTPAGPARWLIERSWPRGQPSHRAPGLRTGLHG